MNKFMVAFLISLLMIDAAQAQSSCQVRPFQLPSGEERASEIRFSDGRRFVVIGQQSGGRQATAESVTALANEPLKNAAQLAQDLKLWLNNSQMKKALSQHREDIEQIKKLIEADPELKLIAVEFSAAVIEKEKVSLPEYQRLIHQKLVASGLLSKSEAGDATLLAAGSARYLAMTEPGTLKGRKLFGFVAEESDQEFEKAKANVEKTYRNLRQAIESDSAYQSRIAHVDHELRGMLPFYQAQMDAEILDNVRQNTPDQFQDLAQQWMRANLDRMKVIKAREESSAQKLIHAGGSAIALVNVALANQLSQDLKLACQALSKNGSKTSSPPGKALPSR